MTALFDAILPRRDKIPDDNDVLKQLRIYDLSKFHYYPRQIYDTTASNKAIRISEVQLFQNSILCTGLLMIGAGCRIKYCLSVASFKLNSGLSSFKKTMASQNRVKRS